MERRAEAANEAKNAKDWKGSAFRRTLIGIVRKHVPESDVEDIVQSALTEALSPTAPTDEDALQRWLIGVARHKIADRHRRSRRESFELPEVSIEAAPHSENDLVRWAERALPADGEDPRRTFEWMMREGEGEKLEAIAASERIPAPRVRKRVSRLRRHLRAAWKKEVALLAALGVIVVLVWLARRASHEPIAKDVVRPVPAAIAPMPALSPSATPSATPTPTPTASATPTPTATPTPSSTSTPPLPRPPAKRSKASTPPSTTGSSI